MSNKTVEIDQEFWYRLSRKEKAKEHARRAKDWIKRNGLTTLYVTVATVATLTPVVLPITGAINRAKVNKRLTKVEEAKENRIYDRSLGCYLSLKRKLSKKQVRTIKERRQNGEVLFDILDDLDLLK